jgi:hypothetical protein
MREPTNDKRIGVSSLRVTTVGSSCLGSNNGLLKADTAKMETGHRDFQNQPLGSETGQYPHPGTGPYWPKRDQTSFPKGAIQEKSNETKSAS